MEKSQMSQGNDVLEPGLNRANPENAASAPEPLASSGSSGQKANPKSGVEPVAERFPALDEQEMILTLFAPQAREVAVAGVFNSWRPEATPLKDTGAGEWAVHLPLRSGRYEYRFVVDGQWVEDPRATQRAVSPHGGFNSVLQVPLAVRTSIL